MYEYKKYKKEYTSKIIPLIPTVERTDQAYYKTLKKMNLDNEEVVDYLHSYDKTIVEVVNQYPAPLLRFTLVSESFNALMCQYSDLKHGISLRSPLTLGYVARDDDRTCYAIIATCKRGQGDGKGEAIVTFMRKKPHADIETCEIGSGDWKIQPDVTKILQLQHQGRGGKELVAGLCDFWDTDIFHMEPSEIEDAVTKYGYLCTMDDKLNGLGKMQIMVFKTDESGSKGHGEIGDRFCPILVASDEKKKGGAVVEQNGMFYLLQYREASRFSRNMAIICGDSLIDNPEYSHTVYQTNVKNGKEICEILHEMWNRKPQSAPYYIFPLSNKSIAESNGIMASVFSKDGTGMEPFEKENLKIGMSLMHNHMPKHNVPDNMH